MSGDFSTAGIRLQGQEGHSLTKNRITLIIFHHIFPVTAITDLHQNQCEDDSTLHHIARSWGTAPVSRGEAFPTICLGSFKTEPDDTQAKRRENEITAGAPLLALFEKWAAVPLASECSISYAAVSAVSPLLQSDF